MMKRLFRQFVFGLKTLWTILWLAPQAVFVAIWLVVELIREDLEDFMREDRRKRSQK